MTPVRLGILLLALIAARTAVVQSEDIPIENDNRYAPVDNENINEEDIQGSGEVPPAEPAIPAPVAETTPSATIEEVQPLVNKINEETTTIVAENQNCPNSCTCHFEGGTDNFVVDCSGNGLTAFPAPLDPKTTSLNIQNNKLTEIPKDIAALKHLKILNANDNSIMDLAMGSISELPELTILKLANNRLIDYPKDLKNGFVLTKLEELDLGGNDMRSKLTADLLSTFKSLRKLTLASSTPELLQDLCDSHKSSLEAICTKSCDTELFECQDIETATDEGLFEAPGVPDEEDTDPIGTEKSDIGVGEVTDPNVIKTDVTDTILAASEEPSLVNGRSRMSDDPEQGPPTMFNAIIEASKDDTPNNEAAVKVDATTTEKKTGGVDKSVIGIVVAAMVVIIAGITIKKNWSSIRKRFNSSPRAAERAGANANGTTPEEVPLQDKDKSPV